MRKVNFLVVDVLAAIAVIVALAGCGGGDEPEALVGETAPNVVQPGAPGQPSRTLSPEELAEIEQTRHTKADVEFVQGMIHHHAQALRMTALVATRSTSDDIELLARRIDVSQESEIAQMRAWLEARGEPAPELHRLHGHAHGTGRKLMPGMLTEAQVARLGRARGTAFDRLFLRFMIQHHRGAIEMVDDLYAGDGGVESEVDALARHIDSDQLIEIARMEQLLAALD
jgi:uncharacterized protein (DUF305 family)